MTNETYIENICNNSKLASRFIAKLSTIDKNNLLKKIASNLIKKTDSIVAENAKDLAMSKENNLSSAMYDRLLLDKDRIMGMAKSIEEIADLEDPIGMIDNMKMRPSGIRVGKMRVPLGVVAVIFESRPNVTTDIAALCIKSGNASILRGGKEAIHSNTVLYEIIKSTIKEFNYPEDIMTLITKTDRDLVPILLKMNNYIDIVIPRGGEGLIKMVSEKSTIPVLKHDKGVCHTFIDESADLKMAIDIAINAKVQRPGVCNAMETLLVHKNFPGIFELFNALLDQNVELLGCENSVKIIPDRIKLATEEDWDKEYLELILSVKIVDSLKDAMDHIALYSSGHSEAIITSDYFNGEEFLSDVDSSAIFINASTRFHDGGEFGLGAEVGISTQKLHARGAMGLEGLTTEKYIVYGHGEIR
jgi:glutamate-5-semialdehyde dehydrogenase